MLYAYTLDAGRLRQLAPEADLAGAIWIDLYRPQPGQAARVGALGISVPTLEDMEEIEISNRHWSGKLTPNHPAAPQGGGP